MSTGRWNLFTASGELLGTYTGATPAEAIRAMYADKFDVSDIDGDDPEGAMVFDRLVRLWGGRASCTGSIPAMSAVTEEPCPATEREGAS